jgi:hypothetical protein
VLALADARCHQRDAARGTAARERDAEVRARRERRRHARHHFHPNASRAQVRDFLVGATEQHRVAALEAHHHLVAPRRVREPLVDEALRGGVPPAALSHRNLSRLGGQPEHLPGDERVVEHHLGLAEQPGSAHREEVGRARPGTHEIDGAAHRTSPAATVWLVVSSMRISAPVARTRS